MDMKPSTFLLAAALALTLGGCGERTPNEPNTGPAANAPATPPPTADTAPFEANRSGQATPPECDFENMDTSQMSEQEHQQMVADCEAAQRRDATAGTTRPR